MVFINAGGDVMAVLMTKDKKEIIVTCNCGCKSSVNIQIDEMEDIGYAYLCLLKGNFYTEYNNNPWRAFRIKMKKIWYILRGKDYCYSDTIMTKEDFEEFKRYINQF